MLKFEWPLILPRGRQRVKRSPRATFDLSEYVVDIAKKEGLAPGMKPLAGRRQPCIWPAMPAPRTWAPKAAEMLRLFPERRCRGDRALLRPWRLLGRDQGEFRGGDQGRQAGGAPSGEERQGLSSPRNVRSRRSHIQQGIEALEDGADDAATPASDRADGAAPTGSAGMETLKMAARSAASPAPIS